METIQIAISNGAYANALRDLLLRDARCRALIVKCPDSQAEGVIVVDSDALEALPSRVPNPERVVLVTRNEPRLLARAWEAGVVSVVFEDDPLDTALLAIMAARLKVVRAARQEAAGGAPPGQGPGSGERGRRS